MKKRSLLTMKKQFLKLFASLLIAMQFTNCSENIPKSVIQPPLPDFDMEYTTFTLDANKGGTITYKTGSTIEIPANSLVDSLGNLIKGEVKLKYREFHDAADIILAGIPLDYDSAGVKSTLATAGMFDIKAFQENKTLSIDSGKNIKVRMASFQTGNEYNFYKLDDNTGKWSYNGTDTAETNTKRIDMQKEIDAMKERNKLPFGIKYFAFNYTAVLDIYVKNNEYKMNTNSKRKRVKHKVEKYGLEWTGIYSPGTKFHDGLFYANYKYPAKNIVFKKYKYLDWQMVWKNHSKEKFPKWAYKYATTRSLKKLKKNMYLLTISSKKRKYEAEIEAVMPLKFLFKFQPEYWETNYDQAMTKATKADKKFRKELEARLQREKEEQKLRIKERNQIIELEAKVFRTFNIKNMGYHNWDRMSKRDDRLFVDGKFKVDGKTIDLQNSYFYYIYEDGLSYIKFYSAKKLQIVADSSSQILAILPDKSIAKFSNNEFLKIDFDALKKMETPAYSFNLKKTTSIKSAKEFKTQALM